MRKRLKSFWLSLIGWTILKVQEKIRLQKENDETFESFDEYGDLIIRRVRDLKPIAKEDLPAAFKRAGETADRMIQRAIRLGLIEDPQVKKSIEI